MNNDEKIGQSKLRARLRLDPCIALWSNVDLTLSDTMTIYGDVYCNGSITNLETIEGDVFTDSISGLKSGQLYDKGDLSLELSFY